MKKILAIINEKGLHARAAARFVETVERFDAEATVEKDGERVGGTSIMGLLMLAAAKGTEIEVETSGNDSDPLMAALEALVSDYFGEGK
jgi:phosphocarrier protein